MDLVLDIGNSAVKGAFFDGGALQRAFDLDLAPASAPEAAWETALRGLPEAAEAARAGLASVVPAATEQVRAALRKAGFTETMSVHAEGLRLPFALRYRAPETLGADRLAAAAAAWVGFGAPEGRPVLALDAGTALTYEVVRPGARGGGVYEGGAIAPGPALLRRALQSGTAQLPAVSLHPPPAPVGRTTQEALRSGLMHGFLDSAAGMIERLTGTLDTRPVVVVTGGWARFLEQHLDRIDHRAPHLVLRGVHTLMALNAGAGEREKG